MDSGVAADTGELSIAVPQRSGGCGRLVDVSRSGDYFPCLPVWMAA